ncbi:MAG: hypothetical protein ACRD2E_10810 [Terriglobales bacterium]
MRAAVNGQAITDSQVRDAAWYSRLVTALHRPGGPRVTPRPLSAGQRRRALRHLITEMLLAQARRRGGVTTTPPPAAVAGQMHRLEALAGGAKAWPTVARRYRLSAATVQAILARQMRLLLFADARCRPQAEVTPAAVAAYYRRTYLPLARRAHLPPAPLVQVSGRIRAILLQRQLMRLEQQWLHRLRAGARIRMIAEP